MAKVLFILLAGGRGERLRPLTDNCPKPMVRFGVSGRIIDFTLYNCLFSGLGNVTVLTQYLSDQLDSYLCKNWKSAFNKQKRELNVLSSNSFPKGEFSGTADAVYQVLSKSKNLPEYIVVLAGDHIYKMDYLPMIEFHKRQGKAATIATIERPQNQAHRFGVLKTTTNNRITNFYEKPKTLKGILSPKQNALISMGVYVFTTRDLLNYLKKNQKEYSQDFGHDIIPQMVAERNACSHIFQNPNEKKTYWQDIGELFSYRQANMEFLEYINEKLHFGYLPGLNHLPFSSNDLVTKYLRGDKKIYNSLVSQAALINKATIENSVIAPGVYIEDEVIIKNSVVLDNVVVQKGMVLENTVIEPDTWVGNSYKANIGEVKSLKEQVSSEYSF